jgi:tRNA (guanine10-N2)-dimethyltransferase
MIRKEYLFELSGEHPTLPLAELRACLEVSSPHGKMLEHGGGYAVCSSPTTKVTDVVSRLALSHRAGRYLGSCAIEEASKFAMSLDLPSGTIAVRAKRFQGNGSAEESNRLVHKVAEAVTQTRKVDLIRPDVKLRVLWSERLHFYLDEFQVDREQFEHRHVRSRPFFSPISLHPRYARVLVNLTRVKKGETLLDPFCGTGGILLEASLIGAKVIGSDISPEMVAGCENNLRHFGAPFHRLEVLDIEDVPKSFGSVDALATDPPYGRSSSTWKEPVKELHQRAFESIGQVLSPSGFAGMVLPYLCQETKGLTLMEEHTQRVHRSLDRHYCVLRRPAP